MDQPGDRMERGDALHRLALRFRGLGRLLHDGGAKEAVQFIASDDLQRMPGAAEQQPEKELRRMQMVSGRRTGAVLRLPGVYGLDPEQGGH